MLKTVTGTTRTMMRASGSTAPRCTLTTVVVVLKADINPVNRSPLHIDALDVGTTVERRD